MSTTETRGYETIFTCPLGNIFTIREQNGDDDDILSNPTTQKGLMNLSHFISAIVLDMDGNGKITVDQALNLPANTRWAIILNSRIFSIDPMLEFTYDWGRELGGVVAYEQDLRDLLYNYENLPTEKDIESKPDAIPYYTVKTSTDLEILTKSGKSLLFDLASGSSEAYVVGLEPERQTKNQELVSRNLRLKVGEKYEKVENFKMFSVKDMAEIRRAVFAADPPFTGEVEIQNPNYPNLKTKVNIFGVENFFFQGVM